VGLIRNFTSLEQRGGARAYMVTRTKMTRGCGSGNMRGKISAAADKARCIVHVGRRREGILGSWLLMTHYRAILINRDDYYNQLLMVSLAVSNFLTCGRMQFVLRYTA
jgi:hypothetical protein